jgi:hypothetical protein
MQWDFWTLLPETAHQVVWLMGDRGLPKSFSANPRRSRHAALVKADTSLVISSRPNTPLPLACGCRSKSASCSTALTPGLAGRHHPFVVIS